MARSRLLSRQTKAAQDAAHRRDVQALAEPLLAEADEVLARERREAAGFGIGPGKDDLQQLRLLVWLELRRTAIAREVGEPVKAMLVVAQHPVAQRLAIRTCRPSCILAAHAIERVGNRQDAPSNARMGLALRHFAQHRRGAIAPDR